MKKIFRILKIFFIIMKKISLRWIDLLFIEGRGHKAVSFLFVHFRDIPGGYAFAAVGAEQSPVILRKVDGALNYPVIIHFYKIALANFLIIGDEAFAISAAYL